MREMRDEFCRQGCFDCTGANFNLECAVYDWQNIIDELIQTSFKVAGIFQFEGKWAEKEGSFKEAQNEGVVDKSKQFKCEKVTSRHPAVQKRQSNKSVVNRIMVITERNGGEYASIQQNRTNLNKTKS